MVSVSGFIHSMSSSLSEVDTEDASEPEAIRMDEEETRSRFETRAGLIRAHQVYSHVAVLQFVRGETGRTKITAEEVGRRLDV